MPHPSYARLLSTGIVLAVATALLLTGCVRRRMTIRTNPPGATVYVDNYELGPAPRSVNFTHYGPRQIRLVNDGYETRTVIEQVSPPWYQVPPLDFITENLVPGEIRDHRTFEYQLTPQAVVPPDELLSRAEALRRQAGTTGMFRTTAAAAPSPVPTPAPGRWNEPPPVWPGQPNPARPDAGVLPPPSGHLEPVPQPGDGPLLHTLPPGGRLIR
jgi:hypothetical protein